MNSRVPFTIGVLAVLEALIFLAVDMVISLTVLLLLIPLAIIFRVPLGTVGEKGETLDRIVSFFHHKH